MAKLTAPLLSFGARGTIAKTQTYATWRGVKYARERVIPGNPQTVEQTKTRSVFAFMREMWKRAPADLVSPWFTFAQGQPFTGGNRFVGENVRVLRVPVSLANFIGSPGAKGGFAMEAFAAAAGAAGHITVSITAPGGLPAGWVVSKAVAMCTLEQDPHGIFNDPIVIASDAAAPYSIDLAGLTPATSYMVSGWLEWTRPDGFKAYSASQTVLQNSG